MSSFNSVETEELVVKNKLCNGIFYGIGDVVNIVKGCGAGFVTSAKTNLHLSIPIMICEYNDIQILSTAINIRQAGLYIMDSNGTHANLVEIAKSIDVYPSPGQIRIDASFASAITNAVNNCPVVWYGDISFAIN